MDKLYHFTVGLTLYIVLSELKVKPIKIFLIVFCVALGKEIYDGTRNDMVEHIKDIFFTVLPVFFVFKNKESKK